MDKNEHQKSLAVVFSLVLVFLYITQVWLPYFYGPRLGGRSPASGVELSALGSSSSAAELIGTNLTMAGSLSSSQSDEGPYADEPHPPDYQGTQTPAAAKAKEATHYPGDSELSAGGEIIVRTGQLQVKVSLLGGRLAEVLLREYAAGVEPGSPPLNLISHVDYAPLPLGAYRGTTNDAGVQYRLIESAATAKKAEDGAFVVSEAAVSFVLEGVLPLGETVRKTMTFFPTEYFVDCRAEFGGPGDAQTPVEIEWTVFARPEEVADLNPYNVRGFVWFDGAKTTSRKPFKEITEARESFQQVRWSGASDKYFMAAMIAKGALQPAWGYRSGNLYRFRTVGGAQSADVRVYAGPKSYRHLEELDQQHKYELWRSIDLGMTGIISGPLLLLLRWFHDWFGNYGLAIIALTILVKFIAYPLTSASFKQMKKMQELAPDLKRIRETVKDKHQQQMDTMALYKKKGVNPLGGCLPMLLQMPIFIGLYSALMLAIELRHAPFVFWVQDLSAPEKCMIAGIGIPVMVILFVVTMLIQQWMTPTAQDPTQKKVMMVMPIVFGFMFMNFPAGLTLYWLTNNVISIGQQHAMRDRGDRAALLITAGLSLGVFAIAFVLTLVSPS